MIQLLYIENKKEMSPQSAQVILHLLGDREKAKYYNYRRWQDKQAFLLGKLLIGEYLKRNKFSPGILKNLRYSSFHRPYISGVNFDFNISHAGEFVVCAFSTKTKVGVDIEKIQNGDLEELYYVLSDKEKQGVISSENIPHSFFAIWSAKEAILKADGCGLVDDLDRLEINDDSVMFNNQVYYVKTFSIHPSYSTCLASPEPIESIHVEEVYVETSIGKLQ